MKEADLLHEVRLEFGRGDCRLWRNNVGALQDIHGNYVTYGLCVGSSDLIGFQRRVITPADVGCEWAVFTALEVKSAAGRVSPAQEAFIQLIKTHGGIAGVIRSMADARRLLGD
jgi:VRR-NUC domain